MFFFIASDLHSEFYKDRKFINRINNKQQFPDADGIIVAGDMGTIQTADNALAALKQKYNYVIFILGNHDFYNSNYEDTMNTYNDLCKKHNCIFLDNDIVEINNTRFLGSTMWFSPLTQKEEQNKHYLNDFNCIIDFETWVYTENRKSLKFLNDNIKENDIVITHHLPCCQSIAKQYANSLLNCFFLCNDAQKILDEHPPKIWIHGHTHNCVEYIYNNTKIICNPLGYPMENTAFSNKTFIEI